MNIDALLAAYTLSKQLKSPAQRRTNQNSLTTRKYTQVSEAERSYLIFRAAQYPTATTYIAPKRVIDEDRRLNPQLIEVVPKFFGNSKPVSGFVMYR